MKQKICDNRDLTRVKRIPRCHSRFQLHLPGSELVEINGSVMVLALKKRSTCTRREDKIMALNIGLDVQAPNSNVRTLIVRSRHFTGGAAR